MSKAFTRESDFEDEDRPAPRLPANLPPGAKNYLTAQGARRLHDELDQLKDIERPRIAAAPDASESRLALQRLDQRIRYLEECLSSAEIVQTQPGPVDRVRFGATVTVRDAKGLTTRYRIVGVDEADADRDWVSWRSPVARALLNQRVGQSIRLQLPEGEQQLEIVEIFFE